MRFKLNDHVRVKPGVLLEETGEAVPDWHGEIIELPEDPKDPAYMIELDAISLGKIPEKYLADAREHFAIPFVSYFMEQDLEPAPRRDTPEDRQAALEALEILFDYNEEDEETLDADRLIQWHAAFQLSPSYAELSPEAKDDAWVIIETLGEWAFFYALEQPDEWTEETVQEVCLDHFPRKFSAEIVFFKHIGEVLGAFFGFLEDQKAHKNALRLQKLVQKISARIVRNAQDPKCWGFAKSQGMQALEAGVDMRDKNAVNQFIAGINARQTHIPDSYLSESSQPKSQNRRPVSPNPFNHLSRNQMITVRYPDGTTQHGKFKRLEADLRDGKCELVST